MEKNHKKGFVLRKSLECDTFLGLTWHVTGKIIFNLILSTANDTIYS